MHPNTPNAAMHTEAAAAGFGYGGTLNTESVQGTSVTESVQSTTLEHRATIHSGDRRPVFQGPGLPKAYGLGKNGHNALHSEN